MRANRRVAKHYAERRSPMTGIYGINYSNNYSLTGNYGYAYSTGAVSSAQPEEKGMVVNPGKSDVEKPGRKSSPAECETCKNRKYQDGSNENGLLQICISYFTTGFLLQSSCPRTGACNERLQQGRTEQRQGSLRHSVPANRGMSRMRHRLHRRRHHHDQDQLP